ncbi:hypothetical protein EMCRGX_G010990 [Ephydatia muelleri]
MWHDVKSLVANEMAKVNEKMEGICQKLSTLEIKVQALEADKGTCTSEAPAEPAKRKRRTPLCLQWIFGGINQRDELGLLLLVFRPNWAIICSCNNSTNIFALYYSYSSCVIQIHYFVHICLQNGYNINNYHINFHTSNFFTIVNFSSI